MNSSHEQQMQSMIADQAAEWFVAHRSGDLSEARREAFIDWLRTSPAHMREYLALTGFSADLKELAAHFSVSSAELIQRAQTESVAVRVPILSAPRRVTRWPKILATAAACAAIAVASVLFQARTSYATGRAEQRAWRLPDGSTVHLNSDSKIKVRFDNKRRDIDLIQGQAIFQVAKNSRRPFSVNAGGTAVTALGTAFDVYRKSNSVVVTVLEGRVAVASAVLSAGQQATVTGAKGEVSKKSADVQKTVAWLQRQMMFDRDPLAEVAAEFNRYNERQLRVNDPDLRREEVSGIFSAYDVDSFVQFLKRQPGMHVEQRGGDIVVSPVRP